MHPEPLPIRMTGTINREWDGCGPIRIRIPTFSNRVQVDNQERGCFLASKPLIRFRCMIIPLGDGSLWETENTRQIFEVTLLR